MNERLREVIKNVLIGLADKHAGQKRILLECIEESLNVILSLIPQFLPQPLKPLDEEAVCWIITNKAAEIWAKGGNITAYTMIRDYAKEVVSRFGQPAPLDINEVTLAFLQKYCRMPKASFEEILQAIDFRFGQPKIKWPFRDLCPDDSMFMEIEKTVWNRAVMACRDMIEGGGTNE